MRIRKRQVPLPLSSLLPVPLSDLYSNRSPTSAARYFHGQDIDGGSSASLLHLPLIQRDVTSKKEEKALVSSSCLRWSLNYYMILVVFIYNRPIKISDYWVQFVFCL